MGCSWKTLKQQSAIIGNSAIGLQVTYKRPTRKLQGIGFGRFLIVASSYICQCFWPPLSICSILKSEKLQLLKSASYSVKISSVLFPVASIALETECTMYFIRENCLDSAGKKCALHFALNACSNAYIPAMLACIPGVDGKPNHSFQIPVTVLCDFNL